MLSYALHLLCVRVVLASFTLTTRKPRKLAKVFVSFLAPWSIWAIKNNSNGYLYTSHMYPWASLAKTSSSIFTIWAQSRRNSDFPFTLYVLARHYTTGGYAAAIFPLGEYGPLDWCFDHLLEYLANCSQLAVTAKVDNVIRPFHGRSPGQLAGGQKFAFLYLTTRHDTGIRRSVVLYCGNAKTPQVLRAKTQNFPCRERTTIGRQPRRQGR